MKYLFLILILSFSSMIVCEEQARVFDFGTMDESYIPGYKSFILNVDLDDLKEKYSPFNGATEFCIYFNYLKKAFRLDTVIETGTGDGKTAEIFTFLFNHVHTIEIDIPEFESAIDRLCKRPNVTAHFGDSPAMLKDILPSKKIIVFCFIWMPIRKIYGPF